MDATERTLRSAAENFHQADTYLKDTEAHLRKLLMRLECKSAVATISTPSWKAGDFGLSLPLEEPVPAVS